MKMALLTCSVFPSLEDARGKLWIFLRSCERFGANPLLYGVGETFPGYIRMKLDMQLDYLRTIVGDYTHVCYSDGWDAFLCAPWSEIVEKYEAMGKPPILSSASSGLANVSDENLQYPGAFEHGTKYCYPHVAGYVAEIPAMIDAFSRMPRRTGDDCHSWFDAWQEGWFRPVLDSQCQIFQCGEGDAVVGSIDGQVRLFNTATRTYPCILGLHGGYTDQVTGKDQVMIPWAERLGIL